MSLSLPFDEERFFPGKLFGIVGLTGFLCQGQKRNDWKILHSMYINSQSMNLMLNIFGNVWSGFLHRRLYVVRQLTIIHFEKWQASFVLAEEKLLMKWSFGRWAMILKQSQLDNEHTLHMRHKIGNRFSKRTNQYVRGKIENPLKTHKETGFSFLLRKIYELVLMCGETNKQALKWKNISLSLI